jgi:hypothetical protein
MSEPFEPEYGNHVGMVVAVNDDGRTKVWVPHLTNTIYTELNEQLKDFSFKSFEKNLDLELRQKLLETLPWAEAAVPTFGGGTSGYVNSSKGVASINPPLPNIKVDNTKAPTTDKQLPIGGTSVPKPAGTSAVDASDNPFNQSYKLDANGKISNPQYIILHDTSGNSLAGGLGHYNIVVDKGVAYESVPIGSSAPHAVDYNSRSVGISLVGLEGGNVSQENKQALANAISWVSQKYNIPESNILTHYEAEQLTSSTGLKATASGKDSREGSWKNDVLSIAGIGTGNASTYANAKDTSGGNDSAKSLNLTSDGKPNVSDAFLRTKSDADKSINKYLQETGLANKQLSQSDLEKWNAYANQYNKNLIFNPNDTAGSWNRIAQAWVNQESGYKNTSQDSNIAVTNGTVNQAIGLTQSSPGQAAALKLGEADAATAARLQNDPDFNIKVGINLLNNQFDKGGIFGDNGLKKVSGSFSPFYDGGESQFYGQNILKNMMTNAKTLPDGNKELNSDNVAGGTFAQTGSSGNTEPNPVRHCYWDAMAENCVQNTGAGSPNGMYSRPVVGSKVWVFFQGGDVQRPVYFASTLERHGVAANYQAEPRTPIEYSSQDPSVRPT